MTLPTPPTLEGTHVRLEPLRAEHAAALWEAGSDPELWRWSPVPVTSAEGMRAYVAQALAERDAGASLPFATIHRASGRVVGSTRYGSIALEHRRLEIGWTWIAPAFQRSAVNTEVKLLQLRHAFEVLGCLRVELKTDSLNARSRAAILRLGAKEEGTFRNHMVTASGRIRHSVWFSVIAEEWPSVRAGLEARLARGV